MLQTQWIKKVSKVLLFLRNNLIELCTTLTKELNKEQNWLQVETELDKLDILSDLLFFVMFKII
jgi:hypothetical protein